MYFSFTLTHLAPLALVWLLIVIFTKSRDPEQSYREALTCTLGLAVISMIFTWLVPPPVTIFRIPVQVVALFFLIDRICECNRSFTWRIIIWYVVITFSLKLLFVVLSDFISQPVEFQAPRK